MGLENIKGELYPIPMLSEPVPLCLTNAKITAVKSAHVAQVSAMRHAIIAEEIHVLRNIRRFR